MHVLSLWSTAMLGTGAVAVRLPYVAARGRGGDVIAPQDGWLARLMRARGMNCGRSPEPLRWDRLGGVFTLLAHEETRMQLATPKPAPGWQ